MQAGALQPYEWSLITDDGLGLHTEDGRVLNLDVHRWLAPTDDADRTVLQRCSSPTLDVGCGPGRFVASLNAGGVAALGLDIAETAIALTRHRGLPAVMRSVFAQVPGEGRWPTVLLMDGNIGIGGDPIRLLHRVRQLLAPGGRVLAEAHPDRHVHERLSVRFTHHGRPSGPEFEWALVGQDALCAGAADIGYIVDEVWSAGGRTFVSLLR